MTLAPAASLYDFILALHIMAVVVAFGWTFALPIMFAIAAKRDPRSLPVLHRIEYMVSRYMLNPALVVVLGAGIFLASDGHHWKEFFVQWGLAAIIVIGGAGGRGADSRRPNGRRRLHSVTSRASAAASSSREPTTWRPHGD